MFTNPDIKNKIIWKQADHPFFYTIYCNAFCYGINCDLSKSDSCLLLFVFSSNSRLCLAVRCDLDTLKNMVPTNAYLASARNYKTDRIYAQHQVNEFNYYGNVITIKCQNGFLYPDRTTEKLVICVLAENSQIDGVYNGYGGTSLPLPGACECELFELFYGVGISWVVCITRITLPVYFGTVFSN